MALVVVRLHPLGDPVSGSVFSSTLKGLTIRVVDLSTAAGETQIGSPARYVAPPHPAHPELPDPDTGIVQHFRLTGPPPTGAFKPLAAATALFEVAAPHPPTGRPEHGTRDLRIEVSRDGGVILVRRIFMNVPEATGAIPADRGVFPGIGPTSLYLALPPADAQIDPADAYVELPADGSPPAYDGLLNAVARVLGHDPGAPPSLTGLSVPQARHVAREIIWNQKFRPLPVPDTTDLGKLYTTPVGTADDAERGRFEARLTAYYAQGDADAERLTTYVWALTTAVDAEARTTAATEAALTFPVLPGQTGTGERYTTARTLVTDLPAAARFTVPARYFYALGAGLPVTYDADQRYRSAVLADAERLRVMLKAAKDTGVITEQPPATPPPVPAGQPPITDSPAVGIAQAVRRLRALGDTSGKPARLAAAGDVLALVTGWLAVPQADIDTAFWDTVVTTHPSGHLDLVLTALTRGYVVRPGDTPLRAKIRTGLRPADAPALSRIEAARWEAFFRDAPTWPADLPDFTRPGSPDERLQAFIQEVRKFFVLASTVRPVPGNAPDAPALLRVPDGDPVNLFTAAYHTRAQADFVFGGGNDPQHVQGALTDVGNALFTADPRGRQWLAAAVTTVDDLMRLAAAVPAPLRFSIAEALYARGFTSAAQVAARTRQALRDALIGTVAVDFADALGTAAGGPAPDPDADGDGRTPLPVNPDGCLVDCRPPDHLSALGPVAYLKALLALPLTADCHHPDGTRHGDEAPATLGDLVVARRGPVDQLRATAANLGTAIPVIDLVDESLEALADDPAAGRGTVHDTSADVSDEDLAARPEHSTPAVPLPAGASYAPLATDVSHPLLPYHQPLDVTRSHLEALGTSRYEVMRAFRRDITEFVIDPGAEPPAFRRTLRRYPLRLPIALEFLGMSPQEYALLFSPGPTTSPRTGTPVWEYYGFAHQVENDRSWTDLVVRLPRFLDATGLDWCAFLDLWRSGIVPFGRRGPETLEDHGRPEAERPAFPDCEPCRLDDHVLDLAHPVDDLRRLAVVIRLWRILRRAGTPAFTFAQLADVAAVLPLFRPDGSPDPDFVRQLAALHLLRRRFGLPLKPPTARQDEPPGRTPPGTARSPLLALWAGPDDPHWDWAVGALLEHTGGHAVRRFGCRPRPARFLEILAGNLDRLSALAGFDPAHPPARWHARPTHTLRFAEVLAKLYAGDLGVGELLFLFTVQEHAQGDDPFSLPSPNETRDDPLSLPDDDTAHSLWRLRERLLAVDPSDEGDEAAAWSWSRVDAALRTEFGYTGAPGSGPLYRLGARLFPALLEDDGIVVPVEDRRWSAPLAGSPPAMWNTPPDGPFRHAVDRLTATLPMRDEDVTAKLARIRQLRPDEQHAVRELLAGPRSDLAPFAFLFDDAEAALCRLVREEDERKRFAFFARSVRRAVARAGVVADHLAGHVEAATGQRRDGTAALARTLLPALRGDENAGLAPWENDAGTAPAVTWDGVHGAALAALLSVTGTGLLGEYRRVTTAGQGPLVWRQTTSALRLFGPGRDEVAVAVPALVPGLDATLTVRQARFAGVRNGFALSDPTGEPLGAAEGFAVRWTGSLLVETGGAYTFFAGAPGQDGEVPDAGAARARRWRVLLRRGQRVWVVLARHWPGETGAPECAAELELRRGAYDVEIEFVQPAPEFAEADDVRPATTGFELAYSGPDSGGRPIALPRHRLYRRTQDPGPLDRNLKDLTDTERRALRERYTGSLRDVRRTYQRAFKALLLAHRLGLSAAPVADDGQGETGYLLTHPDRFSGAAYRGEGGAYTVHLAGFDPDLLPVADPYLAPDPAVDQRVAPSTARQQALTDIWERLFDYTVTRAETAGSPERPLWLLFHESAEGHPDLPADLLRYAGVDLLRTSLVTLFADGPALVGDDLVDERWAIRVRHADLLLRRVSRRFVVADIRAARPDLWASDDPAAGGNANLTAFVADGLLSAGPPRRPADLRALDDGLRERGRAALLAYLTRFDRVTGVGGVPVRTARHLSDLLLQDVEAGMCERVSRVDDAISAVQTLVSRARLGQEPGWEPTSGFLALWDARFARYRLWEACARRRSYRENWVDLDELALARRSEAFAFFETQLRRATLTRPEPGGLDVWAQPPAPEHPGVALLQVRDPATLHEIDPAGHGFDLLGTDRRHARPSWLAAVAPPSGDRTHVPPDGGGGDDREPPGGSGNDGDDREPPVGSGNDGDDHEPPVGSGNDGDDHEPPGHEPPVGPANDGDDHEPPDDGPVVLGTVVLGTVGRDEGGGEDRDEGGGEDAGPRSPAAVELPWWIEAAVRLGTRFLRVAAAGDPTVTAGPATTGPLPALAASSCCATCGCEHGPLVDEYYFWLVDARLHDPVDQDPGWRWHEPDQLPGLLAWPRQRAVRLAWCRVRHGEFGPVRHSGEALRCTEGASLGLAGRTDDSVHLVVTGGIAPPGHAAQPPGFRYDIAVDDVVVLPQAVAVPPAPQPPAGPVHPGRLPAYPYFVFHSPGAPLVPASPHAPATAVAAALRAHCRPGAALGWYRLAADVARGDASWLRCAGGDERSPHGGCCTDSTRASEEDVRRRSIVLHHAETLLEWGDALLRSGGGAEELDQARVVLDGLKAILGPRPRLVLDSDATPPDEAPTVASLVPHPAPPNPRLIGLYDSVEDRLCLIRACLDARRLPALRPPDGPFSGRAEPVERIGCDDVCAPDSPYRFAFLVGRARELAAEVHALGVALQGAFERGDAEFLAAVRADQERQVQALSVRTRRVQWRDADWQVQALRKTKQIALTHRRYYADLVERGLVQGENDYLSLTEQSVGSHGTAIPLEATAQALGFIPDIWLGVAGMGPLNANQLPLGTKLAGVFSAASRIAGIFGTIAGITASERLTEAGWDRRAAEWRHQVEIHDIEIEQIERQILAAERRRDAALHELDEQQLRSEQARITEEIVRDKLTGHALFLWLQQETAALYRQTYELAARAAVQARRAFALERALPAPDFLADARWDRLHEGLLAGERLGLALRRMEQAYLDLDVREYELTKHISLRLHAPVEFLRLQATGRCEIELPEWLFDRDHPGHYLRRIRSVALTVPCVAGPYTGVHARLALLASTTRVSPLLTKEPAPCCPTRPGEQAACVDDRACGGRHGGAPGEGGDCGCGCGQGGYALLPEDPRAVRRYAAREAVATSTGQSDSGMFEVRFRDERYLHFEYQGAVSRWLLELPQEDNQFDLSSVTDVVLHLNYTAREGGTALARAARREARERLPGDGLRVFDVEQDLPQAWSAFRLGGEDEERRLPLRLSRAMFPFLPGDRALRIRRLEFFFEAGRARPSLHRPVRFRPPGRPRAEEFEDVECVASRDWPDLFHGVLPDLGAEGGPTLVHGAREVDLGTVAVPPRFGEVSRLWLLCGYEADDRGRERR
ncbi:neuraminidase-like domain-containing protein [Streptomyces sp. NPDC059894]|uniref:Tc toxin subunit A-related protein n=1 Tax=unclassified Streptomyces TaxID=2593676 RepID=UPI00366A074C